MPFTPPSDTPRSNLAEPRQLLARWPERLRGGVGDYWRHLRLFSRDARLYLLASFLMGINFQVFLVLLNLYLKEVGFLEGEIGVIGSARGVGMTLIAIPAAIMLSRIRLKPMLLVSCVLFAVFSYFVVSQRVMILLVTFSILGGMTFSIYRVAAGPFFMRQSSPVERTHLFSISFGIQMVSSMIGSVASGRLASYLGQLTGDIITGYQYTLYLGIAISLIALIPFGMIKPAAPSAQENRIIWSRESLRSRGGFYAKVFLSNFIVGLGAGLIIPFLNLYFRDRFHLSPDTIGFYYGLVSFSMLLGAVSGPVLAGRLGLVRTVVVTQLASLPFMLVLSYTYVLPLAAVAFIVRGGLMNLGGPIVTNLSMELARDEEQGMVNALLMVGWNSSWMVSTAVGGYMIEAYGYTVTMNITIILYVISALVFYLMFSRAEVPREEGRGWIIAGRSES